MRCPWLHRTIEAVAKWHIPFIGYINFNMAEVICLCNGVWDEDLREYLDAHPIASIEELREQASICNKCLQCEDLVASEIYAARMRRQNVVGPT
jgi:bacterioferritin-associated ferredoxin